MLRVRRINMQIQLKNPKYQQALGTQCTEGDRLIAQMLNFKYLKSRITNTAFENASVVYEDFGTLNITKEQAKKLKKMANQKVKQLVMEDIKDELKVETYFSIK